MKQRCEATGKVMFNTRSDALEILLIIKGAKKRVTFWGKRYKHRMNKPAQKRIYRCSYCGSFHLTKLAWFPSAIEESEKRNN